ncbi:hypothetical protein [Candidatus Nanohalococcus occultus]|uniref:Uncharacterized protein n=1 Tax=Candidatus Nanohalococcus occultus TaxID=2978047 RepID=A0ABY8CE00_9ARCH|nr:hypothetical protein SVXNc_0399 [Candidatus Nanohaloarchaeota archaeon SVXNc]
MTDSETTRRTFLASTTAALTGLAGCASNEKSRTEVLLEKGDTHEGIYLENSYSNGTVEIDRVADASGPISYEEGDNILCDMSEDSPRGFYVKDARDGEATIEVREGYDC